jgi:hypothetical protein
MNLVRPVRLSKKIMKKTVVERSAGIITYHRLNMIEAGTGWRPRPHERVALSQVLGLEEKVLFPDERG